MLYSERRTLCRRGAVDPQPSEECPVFLVGEEPALRYTDGETAYGSDACSLWPAWVEGKRAWLLRRDWCPAYGYSASGIEDQILPFDEGVRILIEHHVYQFPSA